MSERDSVTCGAHGETPATLIWIACALATAVGAADAQPTTPSASAVLASVQRYYASTNQLTAKFRQVVTNTTFGSSHFSDGTLWVVKPDRFRFDYVRKQDHKTSVDKTFAFDGTTLWYVDNANKQIYQQPTGGNPLPAAVSFVTNAPALSTQFNVSIDTSGKYGAKNTTVLKLTPKHPSAQYKQISFVVDPSDWHINESIVVDSNGDTNDLKLYERDPQAAIASSLFQVNPTALPTYKLITNASSGSAAPAPPASNGNAPGTPSPP